MAPVAAARAMMRMSMAAPTKGAKEESEKEPAATRKMSRRGEEVRIFQAAFLRLKCCVLFVYVCIFGVHGYASVLFAWCCCDLHVYFFVFAIISSEQDSSSMTLAPRGKEPRAERTPLFCRRVAAVRPSSSLPVAVLALAKTMRRSN